MFEYINILRPVAESKAVRSWWSGLLLRCEPQGRVVYRFHLKKGGIDLFKVRNWRIWSLGKDEVEPDPMYPQSFSVGAQIKAKSAMCFNQKSEGENTRFVLIAQCYTEAPGKVFIMFINDRPGDLDDNPYVAIKFGDEKPRKIAIRAPSRSPRNWHLYDRDAKWIKDNLEKSSRMMVRWHQYENGKMETITTEFDLKGWNEAFAEIKRRFDEHAPGGWQTPMQAMMARLTSRFGK